MSLRGARSTTDLRLIDPLPQTHVVPCRSTCLLCYCFRMEPSRNPKWAKEDAQLFAQLLALLAGAAPTKTARAIQVRGPDSMGAAVRCPGWSPEAQGLRHHLLCSAVSGSRGRALALVRQYYDRGSHQRRLTPIWQKFRQCCLKAAPLPPRRQLAFGVRIGSPNGRFQPRGQPPPSTGSRSRFMVNSTFCDCSSRQLSTSVW